MYRTVLQIFKIFLKPPNFNQKSPKIQHVHSQLPATFEKKPQHRPTGIFIQHTEDNLGFISEDVSNTMTMTTWLNTRQN